MADFKPISIDPVSGVSHYLRVDELTGEMETLTTQDPTRILDSNQRERYDAKGPLGKADLVKIGNIPLGLIAHWKHVEGLDVYNPDHWERLRKKLDDGDFQKLRIAEFTIGDAQ
ncbi:MAG: hypothetical protein AAF926_06590 [Pseudomonadota bacterium]